MSFLLTKHIFQCRHRISGDIISIFYCLFLLDFQSYLKCVQKKRKKHCSIFNKLQFLGWVCNALVILLNMNMNLSDVICRLHGGCGVWFISMLSYIKGLQNEEADSETIKTPLAPDASVGGKSQHFWKKKKLELQKQDLILNSETVAGWFCVPYLEITDII